MAIGERKIGANEIWEYATRNNISVEEAARALDRDKEGWYVPSTSYNEALSREKREGGVRSGVNEGLSDATAGLNLSEPKVGALETLSLADAVASQNPIVRELMDKQGDLLRSIDPGVYRGIADQIASTTSGYADKMDAILAEMQDYGLGKKSMSMEAARQQSEALRRGLASQLAGNVGGYNPALMRSSQYARAQGESDIAANAALAAANERQSAMGKYFSGLGNAGAFRNTGYQQQADMLHGADALSSAMAVLPEQFKQAAFNNTTAALGREDQINALNAARSSANNPFEATLSVISALAGVGGAAAKAFGA